MHNWKIETIKEVWIPHLERLIICTDFAQWLSENLKLGCVETLEFRSYPFLPYDQ